MTPEVQLTQRQREVAERLVAGMKIQAIADELGITESRVNQIVRALKDRFDVETQAGIAATFRRATVVETKVPEATTTDTFKDTPGESLLPPFLNGPNATGNRLVVILALALLISGMGLSLVAFANMMSDASVGRAVIEGQSDRPPST